MIIYFQNEYLTQNGINKKTHAYIYKKRIYIKARSSLDDDEADVVGECVDSNIIFSGL